VKFFPKATSSAVLELFSTVQMLTFGCAADTRQIITGS
jgi:hypothetical protein